MEPRYLLVLKLCGQHGHARDYPAESSAIAAFLKLLSQEEEVNLLWAAVYHGREQLRAEGFLTLTSRAEAFEAAIAAEQHPDAPGTLRMRQTTVGWIWDPLMDPAELIL